MSDLKKNYYWLGPLPLGTGSIILPGNWSRIVRSTPGHNWALLEEVYENVRMSSFSDLLSRRDSLFMFEKIELAKEFRKRTNRKIDILYKVKLVNKSAKINRLNVEVISPNRVGTNIFLASIELSNQATKYWSSAKTKDISLPEILTDSPIQVIETIK